MGRTRSDISPRIVDAARVRFLNEGVDGASLRAIADDAGTSIGMVYYYFRTKDDLFYAVVEAGYTRILEDVTRACDPALPPVERIRNLYHRIAAMDAREQEIIRLVIREVLVSSKRLTRLLARFQRGHFPVILQTLSDGVREGSIRADLSPLLLLPVVAAVGVVPHFAVQRLVPGAPRDLADTFLEVLLHGIAPAKPGRKRA